ncbi:50S ribosomal protein L10 [Ereboglobus luteus]|uniref:Large ribosomal subunit protein uL10 n=1 Tax=Ereboglobus luteus TaxID=1796921 RepID=A0A2U8E2D9_9BACT|nr:50S ribosomal protein L10 [Ereboglobus luteus]AWI09001.1 50S ribosomal protein L10 [Ereboglobus luteus]
MRAEKQYLITEVETHLKKSDYVILANYTKVTVSDVAELRAKLRAENAEFHVVKNSSLKVAAKALGLPELGDDAFVGPTAILVGGENPAAVAKIIKQFFKEKQRLEIKTGIMEKKVVTADFLSQIADLPSLNELRSSFLSLLTSNAAAFVRVLDAKVKKDGGDAAPAAEAAPAEAPAA